MTTKSNGGIRKASRNFFSLFTPIMWNPWVCKTDQGQIFAKLSALSLLSFCKMLQKGFFFFLFIFVARLPVTERAKAAWKHKCNRGTICQLFSTMPGITGIESKGFKYYQLWWFIPLQGLLASFAPKHFMLCPVLSPLWALASERAWIVCINSSANVELQPLLISSFSVLSLNYSLVCNLALHSLPFSVVNLY